MGRFSWAGRGLPNVIIVMVVVEGQQGPKRWGWLGQQEGAGLRVGGEAACGGGRAARPRFRNQACPFLIFNFFIRISYFSLSFSSGTNEQ